MVQLLALALQYRAALEGLSESSMSPTAVSAGLALLKEMSEVFQAAGASLGSKWKALQPIFLRTTLVPSIVAYWERIQWSELSTEMLCKEGEPCTVMYVSSNVLLQLFHSVTQDDVDDDATNTETILLLQQVHIPLNQSFAHTILKCSQCT